MEQTLVPSFIHGLINGGVYGSVALGLSLIFGVLRVINFAHGAMMMMSCFLYFVLWKATGLSPYIGMLLVTPIMFGFGYTVQNTMIKKLFKRERASVVEPISALILTVGIGFSLENLAMMIFGANYNVIRTDFGDMFFTFGDTVIEAPRLIAALGGVALTLALYMTLYRTELGARIRAVAQNRDAASLCGINVDQIYNITFGIGVAAVTLSGGFLSMYYYVQPSIGHIFGIKSFMIVVLGGLGSIPGALLGGLLFGVVESVGAQFITSTSASMLSFMLFIAVLFFRPKGFLGKV